MADKLYFLRRKTDGKFYRGAKFWKWTKSWRRAALLPEYFWVAFVIPKIKDEYELLILDTDNINSHIS